ncbi:MAG: AAA family ATPase [Candidatus Omnitrophota bacterium]
MRIIAVTNQKGGCGKTTTAVNLVCSLAVNGKKVLLIDLDPQAHATLGLNIRPELNIYNALSKLTNEKAALSDIIRKVDDNFDIAPSGIILSTLEQELAGEIGRESRLQEELSNLKGKYEYIIIDCPPNLGILTINAIRASSDVIIPVEASRFSFEGLNQLIEIINLIRDRLNHSVEYRVLIANFDSRLRHSFQMLDRIKLNFKEKLFRTIIHVNVKLKEAQNQGVHILDYDKYCRGAKDYFSLAREIITAEGSSLSINTEVKQEKLKELMRERIAKELPKATEIVFSVSAPQAKEVYVVGDFNGWRIDNNSRMSASEAGWVKKANLSPGNYRYRFVIDGKWTEDEKNPAKEMNPYGQMDSLIEVSSW